MYFRWRHGQQWRPPCFFICAIIKVRRKPISPKQWKRRDALPLPRCFFFTEMAAKPKAVRADILPLATMRHHLLKLWKKWPSQARLWTYDAIRGTTSGRFSTEIVFSATNLSVDWNWGIMRDLSQMMTTSDLWQCILIFKRSNEVNDIDWPQNCDSG